MVVKGIVIVNNMGTSSRRVPRRRPRPRSRARRQVPHREVLRARAHRGRGAARGHPAARRAQDLQPDLQPARLLLQLPRGRDPPMGRGHEAHLPPLRDALLRLRRLPPRERPRHPRPHPGLRRSARTPRPPSPPPRARADAAPAGSTSASRTSASSTSSSTATASTTSSTRSSWPAWSSTRTSTTSSRPRAT